MDSIIRESPFQPGQPVDPENFQGRKDIIQKCSRYLMQASNGAPQHLFITGKRGMGKSSLASYVNEIAKRKCKMTGVHLVLDGVDNVESLTQKIIEKILNEINNETWSNKVINLFKEHIESVGFAKINIKFSPPKNDMQNLTSNFAQVLKKIIDESDGKRGLFIIIDDINGLTDDPKFANWYKSFADTMTTDYRRECPVFMMLAGYPEKLEALFHHNKSFTRIFHYSELEELTNDEVNSFFTRTFRKEGITIEKDAMELMLHFSSGLPTMMHEIGDAIFWKNEDNVINYQDALHGIIIAGNEIGRKYLQPVLDSSIRSDKYMTILKKLGKDFASTTLGKEYSFRKRDFIEQLSEEEAKVFNDFLNKARNLKILEFYGAKRSGHYKFTSNLYPIYFMIKGLQ